MKKFKIYLIALAASLTISGVASAATISVNTLVDENGTGINCSLREAITSINNGADFGGCTGIDYGISDAVDLGAAFGTINLSSEISITKGVTVLGQGRTLSGGDANRIFNINAPGENVILTNGLTILNGSATLGGAIYVENVGSLTFSSGARIGNGNPSDASVATNGGAIYLKQGIVNLTSGASLNNNQATSGGNIYIENGTLNVDGGTVASGLASSKGGGVYLENGSLAVVNNGVISSNRSNGDGGGIYAENGSVTLSVASLSGNNAGFSGNNGNGGGIAVESTVNIDVDNTGINGNQANSTAINTAFGNGGGIAYLSGSSGNLSLDVYTSFGGNAAGNNGGAVYFADGNSVTYNQSIVFNSLGGNSAVSKGGIYYVGSGTTFLLSNATLQGNNTAGEGSVIYFNGNSTVDVENVQFISHGSNLVYFNNFSGVKPFTNVTFVNNFSSDYLIEINSSNIDFQNGFNRFELNTYSGSCGSPIFRIDNISGTPSNVQFQDIDIDSNGNNSQSNCNSYPIFVTQNSTAQFTPSTPVGNGLKITNSNYDRVNIAEEGTVNITNVYIDQTYGGFNVNGTTGANLTINGGSITQSLGNTPMIDCSFNSVCLIDNISISSNSNALAIKTTYNTQFDLTNSIVEGNSNGILSEESFLTLDNVQFLSSTGTDTNVGYVHIRQVPGATPIPGTLYMKDVQIEGGQAGGLRLSGSFPATVAGSPALYLENIRVNNNVKSNCSLCAAGLELIGSSATAINLTGIVEVKNNNLQGATSPFGGSASSSVAGGIYISGYSNIPVTINGTDISQNSVVSSSISAGGIYTEGSNVDLTITNSTINNNTISGGEDNVGGGIGTSTNGVLNIENTTISGNSAAGSTTSPSKYGGGILSMWDATINLSNSTVSNNNSIKGGGIGAYGGTILNINNSSISGNTSDDNGAGINGEGAFLSIDQTTIDYNITNLGGSGGGAYLKGPTGNLNLTNSIISDNTSTNSTGGGLVVSELPTVSIEKSSFYNNSSSAPGGAMLVDRSPVNITNTTFAQNSSNSIGGAIAFNDNGVPLQNATSNIRFSTFSENQAFSIGGGLFLGSLGTGSVINVENTIIAGNTTSGAPSVDCYTASPSSPFTSLGDNIIGNDNGCNGFTAAGDMTNVNPLLDTFNTSTAFPPFYALLSGSPALNAGHSIVGVNVDQRNSARSATPDVGAWDDGIAATMPPGAPTLNSANVGNTQVSLNWTAGTGGVSSYYVQYGDAATCSVSDISNFNNPNCTLINTSSTNLNYTVTGLTNGTQYRFVIFTNLSGVNSPASNSLLATPSAAGGGTCNPLDPNSVCASQEVTCGASPIIIGTLDNLIFDADELEAGIQVPNVSSQAIATYATQPAFSIQDQRSGTPGCGADPVSLTVQISEFFKDATTDKYLIQGQDNVLSGSEEAAVLSVSSLTQPTCMGCFGFDNSANLTVEQTLNDPDSLTMKPALSIFSNAKGFAGTASIPAIKYKLMIPPVVSPGSYVTTLTYTFSY